MLEIENNGIIEQFPESENSPPWFSCDFGFSAASSTSPVSATTDGNFLYFLTLLVSENRNGKKKKDQKILVLCETVAEMKRVVVFK
jgi:hypothetical protein